MAFDIATSALPFIGVRKVDKDICNFFIEVISSRVVTDTPDELKEIELRCRFLGGILFSQGPAIHTKPKTHRR